MLLLVNEINEVIESLYRDLENPAWKCCCFTILLQCFPYFVVISYLSQIHLHLILIVNPDTNSSL